MTDINIDDLLPHRDRMKLVDEVIEVNEHTAVTRSTVTENWPLFEENYVNPIVLIELVAQTAGISLGWTELKNREINPKGKGWLVGIKEAAFYLEGIPLNSRIITESRKVFDFDNYKEISGIARIKGEIAGKIIVQVVQSDP
jgi:predicted hotdog family 3-hydroxylacyl-ACP dehydratase